MHQLHWMLFKPEGHDVLYLWNGDFSILVHVGKADQPHASWYWADIPPATLDKSEIDLMNTYATTKRKQVFSIPRMGRRRYQVLARGVYEYENQLTDGETH